MIDVEFDQDAEDAFLDDFLGTVVFEPPIDTTSLPVLAKEDDDESDDAVIVSKAPTRLGFDWIPAFHDKNGPVKAHWRKSVPANSPIKKPVKRSVPKAPVSPIETEMQRMLRRYIGDIPDELIKESDAVEAQYRKQEKRFNLKSRNDAFDKLEKVFPNTDFSFDRASKSPKYDEIFKGHALGLLMAGTDNPIAASKVYEIGFYLADDSANGYHMFHHDREHGFGSSITLKSDRQMIYSPAEIHGFLETFKGDDNRGFNAGTTAFIVTHGKVDANGKEIPNIEIASMGAFTTAIHEMGHAANYSAIVEDARKDIKQTGVEGDLRLMAKMIGKPLKDVKIEFKNRHWSNVEMMMSEHRTEIGEYSKAHHLDSLTRQEEYNFLNVDRVSGYGDSMFEAVAETFVAKTLGLPSPSLKLSQTKQMMSWISKEAYDVEKFHGGMCSGHPDFPDDLPDIPVSKATSYILNKIAKTPLKSGPKRLGYEWVPRFVNTQGHPVKAHWRKNEPGKKILPNIASKKPTITSKPGIKPNIQVKAKTPTPNKAISPKWSVGKYIGARVTTKDKDGKQNIYNVTGMDAKDVVAEIQRIKAEGHSVVSIDPPDAAHRQGLVPQHVTGAGIASAVAAPSPAKAVGAPKVPERPKSPFTNAPDTPAPKPDTPAVPKSKNEALNHLQAGGSIDDAPEGTDLLAAIQAMPERFIVTATKKNVTSSDTFMIIDQQQQSEVSVVLPGGKTTDNKVYFAKKTQLGRKSKKDIVWDDMLNESITDTMLSQMGYGAPEVKISGNGFDENTHTIQGHVLQNLKPGIESIEPKDFAPKLDDARVKMTSESTNADWKKLVEKEGAGLVKALKESSDPGSMFRMSLFDFAVLNQDRNLGNFFVMNDNGDHTVQPIDNGYAFEGGIETTNFDFNEQAKKDGTELDFGVPHNMSEWMRFRSTDTNHAKVTMTIGASALGNDEDVMKHEITKLVAQMKKINIKEIVDKLEKQGAKPNFLAMTEESLMDMKKRVNWMKNHPDLIIKELS